jgi:hypothetical protein
MAACSVPTAPAWRRRPTRRCILRRRRLDGHELVIDVLNGATFKGGINTTEDETTTTDEKVAA